VIPFLPLVTVGAENLKPFWVVVITQPFHQRLCTVANLFSVISAIIVEMIELQKQWFRFSAASALVTVSTKRITPPVFISLSFTLIVLQSVFVCQF
jgi:hypothetical protein